MMLNHPALLTLAIGLVYILGFGGLSLLRRQGLSMRFAVEGLVVAAAGAALTLVWPRFPALLFLVVLYLVTMRVRLLADLANALLERNKYERAMAVYRTALKAWPDPVSRQIVLINRGVAELRTGAPETAYATLVEALSNTEIQVGAHYLAAGYYNLGLAARRSDREAEAVRRFNQAIEILPHSLYALGARRALQDHAPDRAPSQDE